jgi:hypothetical protein
MRSLLIIGVVLASLIPSALADLDEARFQGHTDEFHYDVWMHFKPMPATRYYPRASEYWTVFDSLRVIIDGREIKVPKAAIEGFFWPHPSGYPYPGPDHTLRIPITGGDGEKSFEAVLVFSKSRFLEVERREHASSKWKVTKYGAR